MWLWLELLRTPMAAPESRGLKRMRITWQVLCLSCAGFVGFFAHLHRALGRVSLALTGSLVTATVLYTWLYLSRKQRADTAFLERSAEEE